MSRHLAQDLENDLLGIGSEMASLDLQKQCADSSAHMAGSSATDTQKVR